jgi:hypothetical protein
LEIIKRVGEGSYDVKNVGNAEPKYYPTLLVINFSVFIPLYQRVVIIVPLMDTAVV